MKRLLFGLACLYGFAQGVAFENQPWFPEPYECQLRSSYSLSYYSTIDGGYNPPSLSSWNQILGTNLGFNTPSQLDTQLEVDGFMTSHTNPTLMSAGAQGRYLLMNDIKGDPLSLALGLNFRYVPDHALRDPFTPYHNLLNLEATCSLGKEFDRLELWLYRLYAIASVGQANQGAPWVKGAAAIEINSRSNRDQGALKIDSYFGFGSQHRLDVGHHHGYGNIWHQSVDLSAIYRHVFPIWGTLSLEAGYRVWAKNYPANEIRGQIKYEFPFSLF